MTRPVVVVEDVLRDLVTGLLMVLCAVICGGVMFFFVGGQ
jgi:hypothetical protein